MARVAAAAVLAVGLLATVGAHGADGSPPSRLTREALAACLADGKTLHELNDAVTARRAGLEASVTRLQALEAQLDGMQDRLDDAHDREIDAYNAMVDEHARLAAAYNSALPEVNQQIEALNTQRRDYDTRCAQQAYYERDRNALQRDGR